MSLLRVKTRHVVHTCKKYGISVDERKHWLGSIAISISFTEKIAVSDVGVSIIYYPMQKHHKKFYTDPTLYLKYAAILDHKIYDIPLPAINIYTTNFDSLSEANVKTPHLLLFSIYFIGLACSKIKLIVCNTACFCIIIMWDIPLIVFFNVGLQFLKNVI